MLVFRQSPRSRNTRLSWWLAAGAVSFVAGVGLLLIVFYRVPWGGTFEPSAAGPVSGWIADLLTGAGIFGLIYQLSQMRLSRVDETTREINSLCTYVSMKRWCRGKAVDGKLVYVYIQNDGDRKAMDIQLSVNLCDGNPMPDQWLIERLDGFTLPPSMPEPRRVLLFHIPEDKENLAFGARGRPVVTVSWTDAWRRRVSMTDNLPSAIIELP